MPSRSGFFGVEVFAGCVGPSPGNMEKDERFKKRANGKSGKLTKMAYERLQKMKVPVDEIFLRNPADME